MWCERRARHRPTSRSSTTKRHERHPAVSRRFIQATINARCRCMVLVAAATHVRRPMASCWLVQVARACPIRT
eukprot:scaffold62112_cov35-Phaeocystis_antarctica.AAC.1